MNKLCKVIQRKLPFSDVFFAFFGFFANFNRQVSLNFLDVRSDLVTAHDLKDQ
jgi:hypothetical protein